jgi:hypothetical protein
MASGASAVPKTVRAAPAIQRISVVVCGGVLAKKIKPTMASIFKKIEVPEMSSFTRRLSDLRGRTLTYPTWTKAGVRTPSK